MATKRTRRHFDLEAAARQLFEQARAKADFAGAAACLRLLRDLRPSADAKPQVNSGLDVSTLTDEEFEELGRLLQPIDAFEIRVRRRMGLEPAPIALIDPVVTSTDVPEPPPPADEPLEEGEIDVSDLIAEGVDLSWIPVDDAEEEPCS